MTKVTIKKKGFIFYFHGVNAGVLKLGDPKPFEVRCTILNGHQNIQGVASQIDQSIIKSLFIYQNF
jgi:hypothetical protein